MLAEGAAGRDSLGGREAPGWGGGAEARRPPDPTRPRQPGQRGRWGGQRPERSRGWRWGGGQGWRPGPWQLAQQAPHGGGGGPGSGASSWAGAGWPWGSLLLPTVSPPVSSSFLSESRPGPPLSSQCPHPKWHRTQKPCLGLGLKPYLLLGYPSPPAPGASPHAQGKGPHPNICPPSPTEGGRRS